MSILLTAEHSGITTGCW